MGRRPLRMNVASRDHMGRPQRKDNLPELLWFLPR